MNSRSFKCSLAASLILGTGLISGTGISPVFAPALANTQDVQAAVPTSAAVNPSQLSTIAGALTYRERMLPPAGAIATVFLQDISRADAPAQTLQSVRYDVGGHGVPFGYAIQVPTSRLQPNMRYAVRAEIRDAGGSLMWTTDTTVLIDPAKVNQIMPTIMMVRAGAGTAQVTNPLVGDPWRVEYINGAGVIDNSNTTLQFAQGGRLSGSTGCNNYTGTYKVDGNALEISPLAVTERACAPAIGDQQNRFLSFMSNVHSYKVHDDGSLGLFTNDGRSLVATR
ncbi:MAG: META domain-containing protein [Sphingomonadaceae bacterium]